VRYLRGLLMALVLGAGIVWLVYDLKHSHARVDPTPTLNDFRLVSYENGTITVLHAGVKYIAVCEPIKFSDRQLTDACGEVASLVGRFLPTTPPGGSDKPSMFLSGVNLFYDARNAFGDDSLRFRIVSANIEH